METLVRFDGKVENILLTLVREGYYKTKTEAIRAGILELGREFQIIGREEILVSRRIAGMREEVQSGKKKLVPLDTVAKRAGVKI